MVKRVIKVTSEVPSDQVESPELAAAFDGLRQRLELPAQFPAEVEEEARRAVAAPELPERDETAVPFFTIDPEGSTDLDQAMCLERDGDGYRVRYAIADVPAFVQTGEHSTPRRTDADRPSTCPINEFRCTPQRSARTQPACSKGRRGPRSCGT